jgi:imidazolonepropionase-like amidohydrolase
MRAASGTLIIDNGQLIPGTGAAAVPAAALHMTDGRITYAGPATGAPPVPPVARRINARGGTIMPGLVEAHFHPTYFNVAALEDLDIKYPVEYVTLQAASNARLALECGYTAARSGGSLFNIDVWLKKAIENDITAGPRLAASGREICGVGGLMDWNPDYRKIGMEGLVLLINGADEARAAVRKLVKDGVEWVKTYPTGDAAAPDTNDHHTLCMTFEEMHACVATAHNHGLKVTGHCRATAGIKNALRAGYDTLEHGTFMDDEALELLLERNTPVVPALQFEHASIVDGPRFGMPQRVIDGHKETLEGGAESARRILKAGGRLGMGGDYGFPCDRCPTSASARPPSPAGTNSTPSSREPAWPGPLVPRLPVRANSHSIRHRTARSASARCRLALASASPCMARSASSMAVRSVFI